MLTARASPASASSMTPDGHVEVDYHKPLRDALHDAGIEVYNGDVQLFPHEPHRGIVRHRPVLHRLPIELPVALALAQMEQEQHPLADVWTLIRCASLLRSNLKIYSLVCLPVMGERIRQYPYIGLNSRPYIGMTRDSFHIEHGHAILLTEQVLVRG